MAVAAINIGALCLNKFKKFLCVKKESALIAKNNVIKIKKDSMLNTEAFSSKNCLTLFVYFI